tara:strand:+ start:858 stop:1652 length:795 start_codon:yes stop_codon:yes gene_type:complete
MGALHAGHASLFDLASDHANGGDVIATIFVNPAQFGPGEDFGAYPRQLEADLDRCKAHGVTAVFVPDTSEMYAEDASIGIHEDQLSRTLCGSSRPGHFDGVCTVVAKLFLLTQPTAAVFGEKDFQQLAIIQRLVRDLDFPIQLIPCPTMREEDGLAMSSRNAYLSPQEREEATIIYRSLTLASKQIALEPTASPDIVRAGIIAQIKTAPLARIDYVEIVDATTLKPLKSFENATPRLLAAVIFGKTRLIDNFGVTGFNDAGSRD